jgi:hypothetical protein
MTYFRAIAQFSSQMPKTRLHLNGLYPSELLDAIGKVLLAPIELTIGKAVEAIFIKILEGLGINLPPWLTEGLPEVELPDLPAPPAMPNLAPLDDFVANAEKIVNIPEDYFQEMASKIPELPNLPDASEISSQIANFVNNPLPLNISFDGIAGSIMPLLESISGCEKSTTLQVPSLVSLFKTLKLPGTSNWQDCKIEIPVCTQLNFTGISEMDENFSTLLQDVGNSRRRLNLVEQGGLRDWQWVPIPILPLGKLMMKLPSEIFPDTSDKFYGRRGHLGTRTNILGNGKIPLSNLGTDRATFNQWFIEYELLESIYPEIGLRKPADNEPWQFDLVS